MNISTNRLLTMSAEERRKLQQDEQKSEDFVVDSVFFAQQFTPSKVTCGIVFLIFAVAGIILYLGCGPR